MSLATTPSKPAAESPATARVCGVAAGAELLLAGGVVAFATETVYGLGADAGNPAAVARVFAAKGRPRFNPLIVHVADLPSADRLGVLPAAARRLAEAFWPGPLTLVVPRRAGAGVCDLVSAGLDTIALRLPDHAGARALVARGGGAVAAPSANRSGAVSPTRMEHVLAEFGREIDALVDGAPSRIGIESTIVGCIGQPVLLRPGAVTRAAIEAVLGEPLRAPAGGGGITAPGQLASHYAPRATLRLDIVQPLPGEPWLTFGPAPPHAPAFPLSAGGDLTEAAARLYAQLRAADALGAPSIAVMPLPGHGLGEAIADRLQRAAAPRPR